MQGLDPAVFCAESETAQRFLASAYDSVDAVFRNLETIRQVRRDRGENVRGRVPANEEDLLRAGIVFTAAGMDATLKRLIEDALPALLLACPDVNKKFEAYVRGRLSLDDAPATLARYLIAPAPRDAVMLDYVCSLTGDSLQSVEQLNKVAGALGLNDSGMRQEIGRIKPLFVARNEISHELDLLHTQRQGDRARRTRQIQASKNLANQGLNLTQKMVNGVAVALGGA